MWRGGGCRHMVRVRIRWGGGAAMDTTHVHGTIHGNAGAMWSRTRSGTGRATGHGRATSPSEIRPQQSTPLSSQERLRTKPRSLYECTNLMWTDLEHIGRVLPEAAQVDMSSTNIVNRSLECSSQSVFTSAERPPGMVCSTKAKSECSTLGHCKGLVEHEFFGSMRFP